MNSARTWRRTEGVFDFRVNPIFGIEAARCGLADTFEHKPLPFRALRQVYRHRQRRGRQTFNLLGKFWLLNPSSSAWRAKLFLFIISQYYNFRGRTALSAKTPFSTRKRKVRMMDPEQKLAPENSHSGKICREVKDDPTRASGVATDDKSVADTHTDTDAEESLLQSVSDFITESVHTLKDTVSGSAGKRHDFPSYSETRITSSSPRSISLLARRSRPQADRWKSFFV